MNITQSHRPYTYCTAAQPVKGNIVLEDHRSPITEVPQFHPPKLQETWKKQSSLNKSFTCRFSLMQFTERNHIYIICCKNNYQFLKVT